MLNTKITYRVPYADTDQMGVVYYANYLVYFERSRNELFRKGDYSYKRMEEDGLMLPIVEAHCNYKRPALYDDELTISVKIAEIKGCRIRIENEIHNQDGLLLCQGYTKHCFMCKTKRKPVVPSSLFLESLTKEDIK